MGQVANEQHYIDALRQADERNCALHAALARVRKAVEELREWADNEPYAKPAVCDGVRKALDRIARAIDGDAP